jgi:hypothetical protein
MMLDKNTISQSIFNYKNAANSYLKMSDNAKKLGLKDEQTISKNESRYDLDGTLKEEHLPIGSPERTKKKEEAEEEKKVFGTDKSEKTDGNILSKDVRDKEKDEEKGLFGIKHKKDGFTKDPPDCECETCRKRRYQDDSDDSVVSCQSPTNMSPAAAKSKVRSHEMEHVRRESIKARQAGKKVVSQTVQIKTATCEECGRIYVAGGLTRTVTRIDMRDFHEMFMLGFGEEEDEELSRSIS